MEWVSDTKYIGVILQSDLKFDLHVMLKKEKASRTLKHILHDDRSI